MSTVIVTGANSQIGDFLLPRLVAAGHQVIAVSRVKRNEQADGVQWQCGDLIHPENLPWPRPHILVHIAPLRLLPALLHTGVNAGLRQVICFGTTSTISKAASSNSAERAYAAEQAAAEQAVESICVQAGVAWTLFRPTLIYGCGRDRNVTMIARVIRRLGFFPLLGAARGLRQPVHADDLAAACVSAILHPAAHNKCYALPGGETLAYRTMVERIFEALGRVPRFVRIPLAAFRLAMWCVSRVPRFRDFNAEMARRMNEDLVFDCAAAARDLGYQPRPFSLDARALQTHG